MGDGQDENQHELARREETGIAPLGRLRQELVEAAQERSIPRLQRVIGAATVAAEAQRRVARLAEGHGQPAEIVDAARNGSRQAATVQIEAVAAAGRILREMAETGERYTKGGVRPRSDSESQPAIRTSLSDLGTSLIQSSRWQKVAEIPDSVRVEYIDKATEEDRDVTVAGLMRFAQPKTSEPPPDRDGLEVAYDDAVRIIGQLLKYDSKALAGHASNTNTKRRTQYRKLMERLRGWVDQTDSILT